MISAHNFVLFVIHVQYMYHTIIILCAGAIWNTFKYEYISQAREGICIHCVYMYTLCVYVYQFMYTNQCKYLTITDIEELHRCVVTYTIGTEKIYYYIVSGNKLHSKQTSVHNNIFVYFSVKLIVL